MRFHKRIKTMFALMLSLLTVILFQIIFVSTSLAEAPPDENFDSRSNLSNTTNSLDVGNLTFSTDGSTSSNDKLVIRDYSTASEGCAQDTTYFTGNVIMNDLVGNSSPSYFQFASSDLSNKFRMNSMYVLATMLTSGGSSVVDISGYSGGSGGTLVASVTGLDLATNGTYGTVIYSKTIDNSTEKGGLLTFGSNWTRIDTIKISNNGSGTALELALDSLDFSEAYTAPTIVSLSSQSAAAWNDGYLTSSEVASDEVLRLDLTYAEAIAGDVVYVYADGSQVASKTLDAGAITNKYVDITIPTDTLSAWPEASHSLTAKMNTSPASGSVSVTVDKTPPSISISAPSSSITASNSVTYTVTYTGADAITLAGGDITLNKTGTADGAVAVTGSGSTRTVTISSITGDGTLGISIAAATASDNAGNTALSAGPSTTFAVDNTAPAGGSISINGGAGYTVGTSVTLTLSATDASDMMVSEDSGFSGASYEAYSASKSFTLSSGDGTKTVYVKYRDAVGNETSETISDSITIDTTAPTVSVSAPSSSITASGSVTYTVTYTGADAITLAGGDITLNKTGTADGAVAVTGSGSTRTVTISSITGDGTLGISIAAATASDNAGNTALSAGPSTTFTVDNTAPTGGSISINGGAAYTASTSVTLTLSAVGASDMMVSEDSGFSGASYEAYSTSKSFTLSSGDGTKTVYVKYRDAAGNETSGTISDSITLDTTAPTGGSISINGGAAYTAGTSVTLTLSATDASDMMVSEDSGFSGASYEAYSTSKSFTLSSGDGTKMVYVKYRDAAGNETSGTISDSIMLDTTAPTGGSISINGGTAYTASTSVTLTLSAVGASDMMVSEDSGFSGASYEAYSTSKSFTLSSGDGTKTVYVKYRNTAGTETIGTISDSITLDTTAPTVYISAPSASITASSSVTYTVTYTGADAITLANGDVTLNKTDTADGTVAVTGTGNSARTVTISSITGNGTLGISIAAATASDNAGNTVLAAGPSDTFTVDNTAPSDGSISINGGATYTSSTSVTLTLSATGASEMMISEDRGFCGASYEAYATSKSFTLSSGDGTKTVYVKYKNVAGTETSTTICDSITLDTMAPTGGSIIINGGADSTTSTSVTLTLYAAGASEMMISEDKGFCGASYEAYATSECFTLSSSGNETKTVYVKYRDAAGNETSATICDSITLNITDSKAAALSSLSVAPGTLNSVGEAVYAVSVGNSVDSITVTACVYDTNATVKINGQTVTGTVYGKYTATIGLEVGQNTISVVVTAQDGVTAKTYTIIATRAANDNNSSSGGASTTGTTTTKVIVNGEVHDAGTTTTTTKGGRTVTTITVDDGKIEALLEAGGNNPKVEIPISSKTDIAEGVLNGQTIKAMEEKEAVLEVKTDTISYTLPASAIDIDSVSNQIGNQAALKDIAIRVDIASSPASTVKTVTDMAGKNGCRIVVSPVEFEIICTNGDKAVEISKFNAYVERTIAIPEGVDPSKITTGVVLNADGTFTHVPTKITIVDGKYYAKINSLTNSTYTVIYNPKEFKDVENHWAKEAVDDMGSRLVINGIDGENFAPDRDITRAEFAAIMVRALGLKAGSGASGFNDVKSGDWYNGYIKTAAEYGIISGYGNGSFGPTDKVTREQAMTMIARAMKITGLKAEFAAGEQEKLLSGYEDGYISAEYARSSIAECIKAGVVSGKGGAVIAPKDSISRAEVAAMVRRLLQKSGLI